MRNLADLIAHGLWIIGVALVLASWSYARTTSRQSMVVISVGMLFVGLGLSIVTNNWLMLLAAIGLWGVLVFPWIRSHFS
jgi:hypothetical protein